PTARYERKTPAMYKAILSAGRSRLRRRRGCHAGGAPRRVYDLAPKRRARKPKRLVGPRGDPAHARSRPRGSRPSPTGAGLGSPGVSRTSAIALTLRAVGGLTTAEIARAYMVPEATMAQRISRAKQRIKASGVPFEMPTQEDLAARLDAV